MFRYMINRFATRTRVRRKVWQRLSEPLHLNLLSLFVAVFGSFRSRVAFDLVVRQQFAFPILHAADIAKKQGIRKITVIEFGVFQGAGLRNMCAIAAATTKATGVSIDVVGFDQAGGLPLPLDYRDHPELFQTGAFETDLEAVRRSLPANGRLILGDVKETAPAFIEELSADAPLGFMSVDVDYYSSARECLKVLNGPPEKYLPTVSVYLDDIVSESANPWCGELLAVREFNEQNTLRKIAPFPFLRQRRLFKNVLWIDKVFTAHIFDHATRRAPAEHTTSAALSAEVSSVAEVS